jgi:cytochrome P450
MHLAVRRVTEAVDTSPASLHPPSPHSSSLTTGTGPPGEKSLQDLDGPSGWPLVGNFLMYLKKENRGKMHEVQIDLHKQYGSMFKERLGTETQVKLGDPELIEQVLRNQGRYPLRPSFNSWKIYRDVSGESYGILTSEYEAWQRVRSVLSQRLLKPKMIADYDRVMNEVVDDMVRRVVNIRDSQGHEFLTKELPNELYKWALESIGTVLFETRMGCLNDDNLPPIVQQFIDSTAEMMSTSLQVMIGEEIHRKWNTPMWRRHSRAWDTLFGIAKSYIDERLEKIRVEIESNPDTHSEEERTEFLTYLLSSKKLSIREIYANVTECMLGGIDTTSNTLCFALHLLATTPHAQERLHEEVHQVLGDRVATSEDLKNMPYLKCVVKETLRLYPVVTMNVRVLDEDIYLHGYRIPKKTMFVLNHYAACRNEEIFEQPNEFMPERWDREEGHKIHAFASLPFGYGIRSCVGRRIAELELYLAIARMSQKFEIHPHEGGKFDAQLRTMLTPGTAGVPVRLIDR